MDLGSESGQQKFRYWEITVFGNSDFNKYITFISSSAETLNKVWFFKDDNGGNFHKSKKTKQKQPERTFSVLQHKMKHNGTNLEFKKM